MGILNFIKNQLIEVIEWLDDSNDTLVWRFPDQDNEIKNGAKLTVRQGQVAIFVSEGQMGDVFGPGMYSLTSQNIPIMTSLKSWKYGFESPFKAEVYFLNTKQYPDLKWGTKNPIMLRDADFGAVRLRAFGTYAIRINNPTVFMKEVVGTDGHFTTDEIEDTVKSRLISAFTGMLGKAKIPALDLAANYHEIGTQAQTFMQGDVEGLGLQLVKFIIENISLPPNLEKALDTKSSMGIIGNMGQFQQYQAGNAMMAAAQNTSSGNMAGAGMGLGAGMAMGNMFAGAMQPQQGYGQPQYGAPGGYPPPAPPGMAPPPPPPSAPPFHAMVNGQQMGPLNPQQVQQAIQAGQIKSDTVVWAQGMAGWLPAAQVPQLAGLFGATPPPPPPGASAAPPPPPPGEKS
jgi:membrane protease subunit (stomatin/prohibitin family)